MSEKVEVMNPGNELASITGPSDTTKKTLLEASKVIVEAIKRREDSRRLKIFMVSEAIVLGLILDKNFNPSRVLKLVDPIITGELEILRVHHDIYERAFGFLIRHDSFSVHEEGTPFEKVWPTWEIVELPSKK